MEIEQKLKNSFDNIASEYDDITSTFAHYIMQSVNQKHIEDLLSERKLNKILDAGGGTGKWIPILRKYSNDITILDISKESIDIAKTKYGNEINFEVENIEKTRFVNNSFDFIFAEGGVISYTPDPLKMIKEINRVLKINGYIWLDFYNSLGWAIENNDINFKINIALSDEKLIQMPDWDYPARTFNPKYLKRILEKNGFEVLRLLTNGILLNSFNLEDKYSKKYNNEYADKIASIEIELSKETNYNNISTNCQFILRKRNDV